MRGRTEIQWNQGYCITVYLIFLLYLSGNEFESLKFQILRVAHKIKTHNLQGVPKKKGGLANSMVFALLLF